MDELSIPFNKVPLVEFIGGGRVSQVFKGNWHGDVAIKYFHLPDATIQEILKFKEQVSVLSRTKHKNLALFMGASLVAPHLSIVTR